MNCDTNSIITVWSRTFIKVMFRWNDTWEFMSMDEEKEILKDKLGYKITEVTDCSEWIDYFGRTYIKVKNWELLEYYISKDDEKEVLVNTEWDKLTNIFSESEIEIWEKKYIKVSSLNSPDNYYISTDSEKNILKDHSSQIIIQVYKDSLIEVFWKKYVKVQHSRDANYYISFDDERKVLRDDMQNSITDINSEDTITIWDKEYIKITNVKEEVFYVDKSDITKVLKDSKWRIIVGLHFIWPNNKRVHKIWWRNYLKVYIKNGAEREYEFISLDEKRDILVDWTWIVIWSFNDIYDTYYNITIDGTSYIYVSSLWINYYISDNDEKERLKDWNGTEISGIYDLKNHVFNWVEYLYVSEWQEPNKHNYFMSNDAKKGVLGFNSDFWFLELISIKITGQNVDFMIKGDTNIRELDLKVFESKLSIRSFSDNLKAILERHS